MPHIRLTFSHRLLDPHFELPHERAHAVFRVMDLDVHPDWPFVFVDSCKGVSVTFYGGYAAVDRSTHFAVVVRLGCALFDLTVSIECGSSLSQIAVDDRDIFVDVCGVGVDSNAFWQECECGKSGWFHGGCPIVVDLPRVASM